MSIRINGIRLASEQSVLHGTVTWVCMVQDAISVLMAFVHVKVGTTFHRSCDVSSTADHESRRYGRSILVLELAVHSCCSDGNIRGLRIGMCDKGQVDDLLVSPLVQA